MNKFYKATSNYFKFDIEAGTMVSVSTDENSKGLHISYGYDEQLTMSLYKTINIHIASGSLAALQAAGTFSENMTPPSYEIPPPIEIDEVKFNEVKNYVLQKISEL
jgi:hypothetical protein